MTHQFYRIFSLFHPVRLVGLLTFYRITFSLQCNKKRPITSIIGQITGVYFHIKALTFQGIPGRQLIPHTTNFSPLIQLSHLPALPLLPFYLNRNPYRQHIYKIYQFFYCMGGQFDTKIPYLHINTPIKIYVSTIKPYRCEFNGF